MHATIAFATAFASLLVATRARALDPFEIQVYDGTANRPGIPGLELHVNHVFDGIRTAAPPELPPHHQTHFTLEPSIGVLPWWELGGYFQTALRADGTFDYAGVKLRSKFVTPPDWSEHARFGVNLEVSNLPEAYEPDRWGGEVRPIAAWENSRWMFAFNPILDFAFGGGGLKEGPAFEPAGFAKVKTGPVAFGIEYYAALGPIADPLPLREQGHYLYEAVDLLDIENVEVNFGIGEGLTGASNGLVAKVILGYSFDFHPRTSGGSSAGMVPRRLPFHAL